MPPGARCRRILCAHTLKTRNLRNSPVAKSKRQILNPKPIVFRAVMGIAQVDLDCT